jgi:hypothetical protein
MQGISVDETQNSAYGRQRCDGVNDEVNGEEHDDNVEQNRSVTWAWMRRERTKRD